MFLCGFAVLNEKAALNMALPIFVQNPYTETSRIQRRACRRARLLVSDISMILLLSVVFFLFVLYHRLMGRSPSFEFHSDWHPANRDGRFPSVEQRVRIYMSNWYLPMCEGINANGEPRVYSLQQEWPGIRIELPRNQTRNYDSIITPEQPFLFVDEIMQDCSRPPFEVTVSFWKTDSDRIQRRRNVRPYCQDALEILKLYRDEYPDQQPPLLGQFCDEDADSFPAPLFAKFRHAKAPSSNLEAHASDTCVSSWGDREPLETVAINQDRLQILSPIIWKLGSSRHWDPLEPSRKADTPWKDKIDGAVWRGALTGPIRGTDDETKCQNNPRCRFVLHHLKSTSINAGLTRGVEENVPTMKSIVSKQDASLQQLQQYKILVSLEGNDIASGLKWGLLSKSVLLMPPPTKTSWAMEELLEPWVHYIPLSPDGSNAEEMVKWVQDNDVKAQRIAERATLFIYDMIYHPDALRDELAIKREIVRRYKTLWSSAIIANN